MSEPHPAAGSSPTARADLSRGLAAVAALLSAFAIATCGGGRPGMRLATTASDGAPATDSAPEATMAGPGAPGATAPPLASAAPGPAPATVTDVEPDAAPPAASTAPARPTSSELEFFHTQLSELERGARSSPVRVLWLGDSHTAADFWTHVVRRKLQGRFGAGGPGFVHAGVKYYRHSQVVQKLDGKWRTAPSNPASPAPDDDGVFGLGGIRAEPASPDARVTLQLTRSAVASEARWELMYRLPTPATRFQVEVNGKPHEVKHGTGGGWLERFEVRTGAGGKVVIKPLAGTPQLLGVIVETAGPGVVVDTLGINGARTGTPLGWRADAFLEQVRRRGPALIVLAYGANEVATQLSPERVVRHFDQLLGLLRRAAPSASCLIIGPPDFGTKQGDSHPRVRVIEAAQRQAARDHACAYLSALDVMGGEGAIVRWAAQNPPLAQSDLVHLTQAGYEQVGEAIAERLLQGYSARP